MSNQNKQHKFRKSLTFKVLCGLVVLLVLGLVYNFIVAADDAPMTEEEQEEVQQRNADRDTIDIVGNYLWPDMKPSKEKETADEDKTADAEKDKNAKDEKGKASSEKEQATHHDAPIAAPAPDIAPSSDLPAKQTAPSIEKMDAPRIEKIE